MALINCPECGRENISDSAESCPNCGFGIVDHMQFLQDKERNKAAAIALIKSESCERQEYKFTNKSIWITCFIISIFGLIATFLTITLEMLGITILSFIGAAFFYSSDKQDIEDHNKRENARLKDFEQRQARELKELEEYYESPDGYDKDHKEIQRKRQVISTSHKCPNCGSPAINPLGNIDRTMSVAVWGLASGKIGKTMICRMCKHTW